MKRIRLPLVHPLAEMFFAAIQSVTTSMSDSTKGRYRTTTEYFLRYLSEHHPDVRALDQLRREPHVLGWLTWLCLTASATGQNHSLSACHFATPSDGGTGLAPRAARSGPSVPS